MYLLLLLKMIFWLLLSLSRAFCLLYCRPYGEIILAVVACQEAYRHPFREWTATTGFAFVRFRLEDEAQRALKAATDGLVRVRSGKVRATWAKADSHVRGTNDSCGLTSGKLCGSSTPNSSHSMAHHHHSHGFHHKTLDSTSSLLSNNGVGSPSTSINTSVANFNKMMNSSQHGNNIANSPGSTAAPSAPSLKYPQSSVLTSVGCAGHSTARSVSSVCSSGGHLATNSLNNTSCTPQPVKLNNHNMYGYQTHLQQPQHQLAGSPIASDSIFYFSPPTHHVQHQQQVYHPQLQHLSTPNSQQGVAVSPFSASQWVSPASGFQHQNHFNNSNNNTGYTSGSNPSVVFNSHQSLNSQQHVMFQQSPHQTYGLNTSYPSSPNQQQPGFYNQDFTHSASPPHLSTNIYNPPQQQSFDYSGAFFNNAQSQQKVFYSSPVSAPMHSTGSVNTINTVSNNNAIVMNNNNNTQSHELFGIFNSSHSSSSSSSSSSQMGGFNHQQFVKPTGPVSGAISPSMVAAFNKNNTTSDVDSINKECLPLQQTGSEWVW